MNAVMKQVEELVSVELESARVEHEAFHSLHEGYAVLLEEIEESRDELQAVTAHTSALWRCVKDDNALCAKLALVEIEDAAVCLAAEAIQVAAMARKAKEMAIDLIEAENP